MRVSTAKALQCKTRGVRVLGPVQREGRAGGPGALSIPGKRESNCLPTQEPLAGPDEDIDFF